MGSPTATLVGPAETFIEKSPMAPLKPGGTPELGTGRTWMDAWSVASETVLCSLPPQPQGSQIGSRLCADCSSTTRLAVTGPMLDAPALIGVTATSVGMTE